MPRMLRNKQGFTMIEMMVVLIIIAVLIAGGIKFYNGYIQNARITKAKSQITTMQAAMDSYYSETGSYPQAMDALKAAGINTEQSDPWGGQYTFYKSSDNKEYVILSSQDINTKYVYGHGKNGTSDPPDLGTVGSNMTKITE